MTTDRKPGWYWVKFIADEEWDAAKLANGRWQFDGLRFDDRDFSAIGPRIPTPDEVD